MLLRLHHTHDNDTYYNSNVYLEPLSAGALHRPVLSGPTVPTPELLPGRHPEQSVTTLTTIPESLQVNQPPPLSTPPLDFTC